MSRDASELARRLARDAEAVCRHYLSKGRRQGRYWTVGDVRNTAGRSMFVRLSGPESGPGAAGHWTDAASSEHGDLLDVIRESCGLVDFRDVADEARRFLSLPRPSARHSAPRGSPEAARRLFAISQPLHSTLAESYLRARGISELGDVASLRFHPRCYYRPDMDEPTEVWPALIAAVTDLAGEIKGVQRTWLNSSGSGKAPIDTPRRAMGDLLGNAVRFGKVVDVIAAGEGIETMLSLKCALPDMPVAAALSANHLAALLLPVTLRALYIARDADPAGDRAVATLSQRARLVGIEPHTLSPAFDDFNEDLRRLGLNHLRAKLRSQLAPQDVCSFADD